MTKEISIEYAHIYTNKKIGKDQLASFNILSKIDKNKEKQSLVVMVDDYSFPNSSFDYKNFYLFLKNKGFEPDLVIRESQLIPLCDKVLKLLKDEKIKKEVLHYIKIKRYPCSLFIASWYLLRLGYISSDIFDKKFVAKKLLNIISSNFKPFENKALKLIKVTKFMKAVNQIEYKYL